MPVFEYEIDYGDPWPARFTGESMGASHVAAWSLTPVANLDVNQQLLQNQELAFVPDVDGAPLRLLGPGDSAADKQHGHH